MLNIIKIYNVGEEVLNFIARPGCYCDSMIIEKSVILVNDSSTIRYIINTKKNTGIINRVISIRTNEKNNPVKHISISANIIPAIDIQPRSLWFNANNRARERRILFVNNTLKKINIKCIYKPKFVNIDKMDFNIAPSDTTFSTIRIKNIYSNRILNDTILYESDRNDTIVIKIDGII